MTTASMKQTRTPTLGAWALTAKLGRRREYILYSAQHVQTGQAVYLRILSAEASAPDRDRFLTEASIASRYKEHFLAVESLCSYGDDLVAVSEIPENTLAGASFADNLVAIIKTSQKLCEALQILHEAGRVHGALCREAIELVDTKSAQVRLLDMGVGLELGQSYSTTRQCHLPPEVHGNVSATVDWDIYALGVLGLEMMADPSGSRASDPASKALRALFMACTAEAPDMRPYTLSIVQRRLSDIARLQEAARLPAASGRTKSNNIQSMENVVVMEQEVPKIPKAPRPPSRAARLTPVEAQWFVNDCLTEAEVAAIDGFEPEKTSVLTRVFGSLLSVTAGTALALMLAAILGLNAFGY